MTCVTGLGYFWKVLATSFFTKVAAIFGNFSEHFAKQFLIEIYCGYFLGNICTKSGYFLFQHLVTLITRELLPRPDRVSSNQCDLIGQFLKVIFNKILYKKRPKIWQLFAKSTTFSDKITVATFGTPLENLGNFVFKYLVTLVATSVTKWIGYIFNILPFSILRICLIAFEISQSKLKTLANTDWTLSKWPKLFNVAVKWRNFAKSGHTGLATLRQWLWLSQLEAI